VAASVSGSKTCTVTPAPQLPAATLTTLMATPLEQLTVAQFFSLYEGLAHIGSGDAPTKTLGSIFI
jgi:hypothetical protein